MMLCATCLTFVIVALQAAGKFSRGVTLLLNKLEILTL